MSRARRSQCPTRRTSRAEDIDEIEAVGALVVERAFAEPAFQVGDQVKSSVTETPASSHTPRRSSPCTVAIPRRILSEISGLGERRCLPLLANPAALRYEGGGNFGQPAIADGEGRQSRFRRAAASKRLFDHIRNGGRCHVSCNCRFLPPNRLPPLHRRSGCARLRPARRFNLFRAKMIGEFFANMQAPSVAVSATKVEPTPGSRRSGDRHALGGPGRRRGGAGGRAWCRRSTSPPTAGEAGRTARPDRRRGGARRPDVGAGGGRARPHRAWTARMSLRKTGRQLRRGRWRRRRARSPPRNRRSTRIQAPSSTRRRSRRRSPARSAFRASMSASICKPGT